MEHEQEIRRSLDYIERNLSSRLRLEELSKIACLSKYHYHRLFQKMNGESVMRYITRRRMARAASELVRTDARILDIAVTYQFSSQEAFSRAFKNVYGLTPGEYRRQFTTVRPLQPKPKPVIHRGGMKRMAA